MMDEVIRDECRYEIVAVVITRLHTQRQRVASGFACGLEQIRPQLVDQKLVGLTLIHKQRQTLFGGLHQLD